MSTDTSLLSSVYSEWRSLFQGTLLTEQGQPAPVACSILADWCEEHGHSEADVRVLRLAGTIRWNRDTESLAAAVGVPAAVLNCYCGDGDMPSVRDWFSLDRLSYAGELLAWYALHQAEVQKRAAQHRLRLDWLERASQGDADALLAHPEGRRAVAALAEGKRDKYAAKPSSLAPRKAVSAAKARMAERLARREARKAAEQATAAKSGRIRALYLARLKARAVEMGEEYHRSVKSLYRSAYARVAYGHGGQEERDDSRYSKGWHRSHGPATCCLAGARLDSEDTPTCVILENYRGTEQARLPLE